MKVKFEVIFLEEAIEFVNKVDSKTRNKRKRLKKLKRLEKNILKTKV